MRQLRLLLPHLLLRPLPTPPASAAAAAWWRTPSCPPISSPIKFSTARVVFNVEKEEESTKNEEHVEEPFDTRRRPGVKLDPEVREKVSMGLRPPGLSGKGVKKPGCIHMSETVTAAIDRMLKDDMCRLKHRVDQYLAAGVKLRQYLFGRHPPTEASVKKVRMKQAKDMLLQRDFESELTTESLSPERLEAIEAELEKKVADLVQRRTYNWRPVNYDGDATAAYLVGKAPFDYACIIKVMREIKIREPDFQPRTLFDFGSGVGTSMWAFHEVFGQTTEVFAVDTSADMNDMARAILLEGKSHSHSLPAGHFFRMHLPVSNDLTYDLATSCFTLLELPSAEARLTAVDNLWRKTAGYLVLIEEGTNAGFQVLAEARDYLIQLSRMNYEDPKKVAETRGHLFAPCPHSHLCPRYFSDTIPCNFDVRYRTFQVKGIPNEIKDLVQTGRFSYLIFKKGEERSASTSYPRLVAEPVLNHKHIICRMCTERGKLEEFVATKNREIEDSKLVYRYAKQLHCGDQFRVELTDPPGRTQGDKWARLKARNKMEHDETK